ncbi:MAG: hydrolase [Fusobacteriia bacterium 4572_132]|nr:MAG: hydrolase [Fusobacteriia bacterium 4572_132]
MKVAMLGSGSAGNSTFIETDGIRFLIDAGFSGKQIKEKLEKIDIDARTLSALLITHEHGDHIKSAGILSRRYDIPIYINEISYKKASGKLGKIKEENLKFIKKDFKLGETISVSPFEVLHDAEATMGFSIENSKKKKLTLATDIGYITNIVKSKFENSDVIIIESNYDYQMLMQGPYPWDLKNRVKGRNGHLSNADTAKFIENIYNERLQKAFLVHISKDNNTYELAQKTTQTYLKEKNIELELEVVKQEVGTGIFEIK